MHTRSSRSARRLALLFVAVVGVTAGCPGSRARDPKKSNTRLDLAKDFLRKGQLEAAEQEGRKALGFDDQSVDAHNILGLVDYVRALNNFKDREIDQCLTGVDREAALPNFDRYLKDSDAHFSKAVSIASDFGEGWANRGAVALQLEENDRALEYLERGLGFPARLENVALTRSTLGWAYFQKKDYVNAAMHLRQSLQFQPGMCVSTYRLGRVYFARKEWQKALEKFQAVTGDADCPIQEAHLYLIMTYQAMRTPVSKAAADRCIALAPDSCLAARCRALLP
jgi:Tfp pilus assembly protein PilF